MDAKNRRLELEMENLARAKRFVLHRSPGREPYGNRISYFVCDYNNFLLFPAGGLARPRGASAEEIQKWFSANWPSDLPLAN